MELFFLLWQWIEKTFLVLVPFFVLLGGLIFIHELGHFLVARFFKVKVEVFSLGFGPKILKYKKGDTLYCLSLLPLGGYVKMFGDNPLKEPPEDQKHQGFLYKKVYQKWLIAFAGPFFNLLFSLIAFFVLGLLGVAKLPAQLGDVSEDSQAFKRGFRSGDQILAVNGQKISYYDELDKIFKTKSDGESLSFDLKNERGESKTVTAGIQKIRNSNPLTWNKERSAIKGFTRFSKGLSFGVPFDSLAYQKGLRSFDTLLAVHLEGEFKPLSFWRELKPLPLLKKYKLQIQRGSEVKTLLFELETALNFLDLGVEPSDLYIAKVGANTPAERAGFKKGDRLLAIDGKRLIKWEQLLEKVEKSKGESLEISYQRESEIKKASLIPESLFVEGNTKSRSMIGIVSARSSVLAPEILKQHSVFESLIYSGVETWKWLNIITTGLVRLVTGEFSIRSMGGPIAIGRVAHSSFSQGFSSFLFIMILISLNLFLLNLLPLPVLDGGHILFFSMEAVLGRPISLKKLLIAQNIGLVFILGFMVFAVFNDIYNWLNAW